MNNFYDKYSMRIKNASLISNVSNNKVMNGDKQNEECYYNNKNPNKNYKDIDDYINDNDSLNAEFNPHNVKDSEYNMNVLSSNMNNSNCFRNNSNNNNSCEKIIFQKAKNKYEDDENDFPIQYSDNYNDTCMSKSQNKDSNEKEVNIKTFNNNAQNNQIYFDNNEDNHINGLIKLRQYALDQIDSTE